MSDYDRNAASLTHPQIVRSRLTRRVGLKVAAMADLRRASSVQLH
jgi:hypothetical protein